MPPVVWVTTGAPVSECARAATRKSLRAASLKASYSLPTDLVAGGTYEVTAAANVTGCLLPSAGSAYVTVTGEDDDIAGEDGDEEGGVAVVNRGAPAVPAVAPAPAAAPSSGLLPSVGAQSGTALMALGGAGLLAAGLLALARARRTARA